MLTGTAYGKPNADYGYFSCMFYQPAVLAPAKGITQLSFGLRHARRQTQAGLRAVPVPGGGTAPLTHVADTHQAPGGSTVAAAPVHARSGSRNEQATLAPPDMLTTPTSGSRLPRTMQPA